MKRPLLAVCLLLLFLSVVRMRSGSLKQSELSGAEVLSDKETLTLTGQVYRKESKDIYLKNVSVFVSDANPQKKIPCKENFIYSKEQEGLLEASEEPLMGQEVCLRGVFRKPSAATNPGEFDSEAYYRTLQIGGRLEEVTVLAKGEGYAVLSEALYRLRLSLEDRLYHILPAKEASIMSTMLLGERAGLDSNTKQLYQRNGIIHILSISGLHITLLGMGLYKLLRRVGLKPWKAAVCGGAALILYGMLVGMSVSVCRALVMYGIRMLGEVCGRTYDMLTALSVAGAATALLRPLYLYHAGFLLSYGAVLGVGVLYPAMLPEEKIPLRKYEDNRTRIFLQGYFQKGKRALTEAMCAGTAILLTTLPIQLWFYYETPTYAVFLNLLVLPLMKPVILSGMLAMLVPGLGRLAMTDRVILAGYESLCLWCDKLPFHTWNPGKPQMWQVVCYYGMLGAAVWLGSCKAEKPCKRCKKNKRKRSKSMLQILLLTIAVICLGADFDNNPKVTFLDVGQGDCICMEDGAGGVYLFDGGSSSKSKVGKYILLPFLKQAGISKVDAVLISHADSDHLNGVMELLQMGETEGVTIERLILPDIAEEGKAEEFAEILQAAGQEVSAEKSAAGRKSKVQYVKAGDQLLGTGITITCLHPPKGYETTEKNAYSECFLIELAGRKRDSGSFRMLLTGDVDGEGEELLLLELRKRGISKLSLLKAAHHGSAGATSEELLAQISPQVSVISCGENNRYGHPHEELLERLADCGTQIFQTKDSGAITVRVSKKGIRIAEFCRAK